MCPELLGEIREVLTTRPRLRKWISLETATLFVDTIEVLVDLVDDPTEVQTETRDPNDDYLVALARTHDVAVIVSGDKDLLEWEAQSPPVDRRSPPRPADCGRRARTDLGVVEIARLPLERPPRYARFLGGRRFCRSYGGVGAAARRGGIHVRATIPRGGGCRGSTRYGQEPVAARGRPRHS